MTATALKKIQQTEELKTYLKAKAGLKNTTAIIGVLANDNSRITAFNTFVEKRQTIEGKEIGKNEQTNPKTAIISQSHDDLMTVIQVIREQKLEKEQAVKLLKDVEAIRTLETFQKQDMTHYSTPALKELRQAIALEDDTVNSLDVQKISERDISAISMSIAVEARNKAESDNSDINVERQQEMAKLPLADMSAEEVIIAHQSLNQEMEITQNLNEALATLGGDGKTPENILEDLLKEEVEIIDETKIQEARNDGDRVYLVDKDNNYYARGDVETIKMVNEVPLARELEFQDAMSELVNTAFNKATSEDLDAIRSIDELRMVRAENGVGGGLKPVVPK